MRAILVINPHPATTQTKFKFIIKTEHVVNEVWGCVGGASGCALPGMRPNWVTYVICRERTSGYNRGGRGLIG